MKKISEFTGSKNVIHIKTKKQAKGIAKLLPGYGWIIKDAFMTYGSETCIRPIKPCDKIKTVFYSDYNHAVENGYTIHKASDFLPKKSKLAKRVKILEIQMAEMMDKDIDISTNSAQTLKSTVDSSDNKIYTIDGLKEVFYNGKPFPVTYQGNGSYTLNVDNIEVKDAKQELSTLPEKWRIKVTTENAHVLTDWKKKISNGFFYDRASIYEYVNDNGGGGNYGSGTIPEITFEQFLKWVLKEDVSKMESTAKLEVGKWYIYPEGAIMCNVEGGKGYGINGLKDWVQNAHWLSNEDNGTDYRLATTEEISTALIAEAKKRGFVDGAKIKSEFPIWSNTNWLHKNSTDNGKEYRFDSNDNELIAFGVLVFKNGQWAEIVPTEFDWSKSGQLVQGIDEDEEVVIVTTGNTFNNNFSGLVVSDPKDVYGVYEFSYSWFTKAFKPYTGEPIILKNHE